MIEFLEELIKNFALVNKKMVSINLPNQLYANLYCEVLEKQKINIILAPLKKYKGIEINYNSNDDFMSINFKKMEY